MLDHEGQGDGTFIMKIAMSLISVVVLKLQFSRLKANSYSTFKAEQYLKYNKCQISDVTLFSCITIFLDPCLSFAILFRNV